MNLTAKAYKESIKLLIKKRKKNYDQLAEHLELSLATVKRILNQDELGFERLLKICKWLDVSLSELDTLALRSDSNQKSKLDEDQELFLASSSSHLAYYFLLFDLNSDEIKKKYKLNDRSQDRYLIDLEKNGLIKIQQNGSVQTTLSNLPHWTLGGPLSLAYSKQLFSSYNDLLENMLEKKIANFKEKKKVLPMQVHVWQGGISDESWTKWKKEHTELFEELTKISNFESKFLDKNLLKDFIFIASNATLDSEEESYEVFGQTFGKIKNILD